MPSEPSEPDAPVRPGGGSAGDVVEPLPRVAAPSRRRPSGEPPPLPRRVSRSSVAYLALTGAVAVLWIVTELGVARRALARADHAVLALVDDVRTSAFTSLLQAVDGLGSPVVFRACAWATVAVLLVSRRFQHLFAYLAVVLAVSSLHFVASEQIGRMRPTGVAILGPWEGYSHPSRPVGALTVVLVGALYTLVPAGRWRARAAWLAGAAVATLVVARVYLAVDHPSDALVAVVTGGALPVVAFRLLVPDEVVPVRYRRGARAHLDVGGRRGQAIRQAVADQLGLDVFSVEPFALSASAGSTPLRIGARDGAGRARDLFGKLYAVSHLRSDRYYKLVRTLLYGRLEDERPFNAVRRLVEHEDYMLAVMRNAGVPSASPLGFVEITPEREYLLVTEFLAGAVEIERARVDGAVIDDALGVVRRLWDAGLAHRDIKPANVLVRDGEVLLIDVAFAAVRPSPWRQAVDLANMMLTLALRSTPEAVYERALAHFSPDDVAEAFAATRAITVPSQLRAALKRDGRDLVGCFRWLGPEWPPVAIQRWSLRRVGLSAALLGGAALVVWLVVVSLRWTELV